MKRWWMALAVPVLVLTLVSCGGDGGQVASDPNGLDQAVTSDDGSDQTPGEVPGSDLAGVPAAPGVVATRNLATVLDDAAGPQLCLGAIAESYPPQCSGLPVAGWSWADQDGVFEKSNGVRWGLFHVTGTFDGTTFTVAGAIPAALYDAPAPVDEPDAPADDNGSLGPAEDRVIAALDSDPLPGQLVLIPTAGGVTVHVVYDDGSLQQAATRRFGGGAVTVSSALVDLKR